MSVLLAEDLDKLREMEMFGEDGRDGVWTVMANVMEPDSLHRAFDGCTGVFHTSAFVDPGGMSGYTVSDPRCYNLHKLFMCLLPTLSCRHVEKHTQGRRMTCFLLFG